MPNPVAIDFAAAAARLVVDEGLDYSSAKRKAARALGLGSHAQMPSNEEVEDQVREHLALFHGDSQPGELAALRRMAAQWMQRLEGFEPHLYGAVWRGTATRRSPVQLELYCDDPKSAEIELINMNLNYEVAGRADGSDVLALEPFCAELGERVWLWLHILDRDRLRGALKPDSRGRSWRGDAAALQRLMTSEAP